MTKYFWTILGLPIVVGVDWLFCDISALLGGWNYILILKILQFVVLDMLIDLAS